MAQSYPKISTPIRTIKSEIGQVRIQLFNDQVSLQFQPATGQKTQFGTIQYNGSPQAVANVRFSVGVAAGIASLLKKYVIPCADSGQSGHWEVFCCKRKTYESYLNIDVQNGIIGLTGIELMNGSTKRASYTFPVTVINEGQNKDKSINIQGEALAMADLFEEIGSANEMPVHMRSYNQAIKDNMPEGGFKPSSSGQAGFSQQPAQPMNQWHPY